MAKRESRACPCPLWLALLLAAGCASKQTEYGSETHWLAECSVDRDCGDGELHCVCRSCTRACDKDASCGAGAACYDLSAPFGKQCGTNADAHDDPAQCLLRCERDAQCGGERRCVQGACVAARTALPSLDSLAPIADGVSLAGPVAVPQPVLTIADSSLLGTWEQTNCDQPDQHDCTMLMIERDTASGIVGSVTFHPAPDASVQGPFPKAIDPDRAYPPDLSSDDANAIMLGAPGVPYRMLDGDLTVGRLTFTLSYNDLWNDWCALQTPYPWYSQDRVTYLCAPQDEAARSGMEPRKVGLCGAFDLSPPDLCGEVSTPGTCGYSVCHCTADGCSADLHILQAYGDLKVDNDRMTGRVFSSIVPAYTGGQREFVRVSP